MAQTDSTRTTAGRQPLTTYSIGGSLGESKQYYQVRSYAPNAPAQERYQQQYQLAVVGVSRTVPILKRSTLRLELLAGAGQTRLFSDKPDQATTHRLFSVSPYVEIGHPLYFHFGMGAHLGDVAYDFVYKPKQLATTRVQVLIEGGKFSQFFVHASFNRGMQGLGNGTGVFGLGSGFGSTRHRLLLGMAAVNSEINALILSRTSSSFIPVAQARLGLGRQWELESFVASNFKDVSQAQLQLHHTLLSHGTRR